MKTHKEHLQDLWEMCKELPFLMLGGCLVLLAAAIVGAIAFFLAIFATEVFAATGASYTVTTSNASQAILERALQENGMAVTVPNMVQLLQKLVDAGLRSYKDRQDATDTKALGNKYSIATPGAQSNAVSALNAGITAPTVTSPGTQTSSIAATVTTPINMQIIASDPYSSPMIFSATGLPPGLTITGNGVIKGSISTGAQTGSPYTVTVRANSFPDIFGQAIFTWNVTL
jgi:hypothetical protein